MTASMRTIPLFDIAKQNKPLLRELEDAMRSVIEQGSFVLGEQVEEF